MRASSCGGSPRSSPIAHFPCRRSSRRTSPRASSPRSDSSAAIWRRSRCRWIWHSWRVAPPLIAELQRRRVFRALVGYGIAAFAVLQIIEPLMHGLRWPDSVISYVVAALAVGFPLVVGVAWIFDVKAAGAVQAAPMRSGRLRVELLL